MSEVHDCPYEPGNYLIERDAGIWEPCELEEDYMSGDLKIRFCGDAEIYDAEEYIQGEFRFFGPIYPDEEGVR